jgi:hypothetical protein
MISAAEGWRQISLRAGVESSLELEGQRSRGRSELRRRFRETRSPAPKDRMSREPGNGLAGFDSHPEADKVPVIVGEYRCTRAKSAGPILPPP